VITGGEPMLFAELLPLCAELRRRGRHITIETNGTLYLPVACDLMSISPKLDCSGPPPERAPQWVARHERCRHAPEVIHRLIAEYVYQFKFVVNRPADCDAVERYLNEFPEIDRDRVLLMPQGVTREELAAKEEWLPAACQARGWKFCPRRQIEWFGHKRQT
jgi:7-carboxy-7-deazaguanine synthase